MNTRRKHISPRKFYLNYPRSFSHSFGLRLSHANMLRLAYGETRQLWLVTNGNHLWNCTSHIPEDNWLLSPHLERNHVATWSFSFQFYKILILFVFRSIDNDKLIRGQPIDPRRNQVPTEQARAKHAQFMNKGRQDGRPKAAEVGKRLQSLPAKKENQSKQTSCWCWSDK